MVDADQIGTVPSDGGSRPRRRLLALLAGLPAALSDRVFDPGSKPPSTGCPADPTLPLFGELRALLDRHDAALTRCDALEARLEADIGHPRVALPRDLSGVRRFAADAAGVVAYVPPGRGRERRLMILAARQRRWIAATEALELTAAQLEEALLDEAVSDAADTLLAAPAWSVHAVALKLMALIATREPGPVEADQPPWRALRLILVDLGRLAAEEMGP